MEWGLAALRKSGLVAKDVPDVLRSYRSCAVKMCCIPLGACIKPED